jgi:hypothetical protein
MPSQMGDGLPLVDLGSGRTATKIAAGQYAACAVLDDGSLKYSAGGVNGSGKGGLAISRERWATNSPPLSFGGRLVVNVAVGACQACARQSRGATEPASIEQRCGKSGL